MSVGDSFHLSLGSGLHWRGLKSASTIVSVTNIVAASTGGLTATVTATAPGSTTLSASGAPVCAPSQACPQIVLLWTLSVDVSAASAFAPIAITTHDVGRHFTVRVGQRVLVRLSDVGGARWSEPVAHSTNVHRIAGSGGDPARATFVGAKRGSTTVTSDEKMVCLVTPCEPTEINFRVTIHVE
jgi:hypothetical protein